MNGWRFRLLLGCVMYAATQVHSFVFLDVANNEYGMLAYHGSAAAIDLFLLYSCPWLIEGRLCDDIQMTCWASMFVNALGWALYLAYTPPVIYNSLIAGLCYVQFARLLFSDHHVDTVGRALLRGLDGSGSKFHPQEAN